MENLTESPARERQRAAAKLLLSLLDTPLPVAAWTIYTTGTGLSGLIPDDGDEGRRDLAAWAAHLGGTVVEERDSDGCLRGYVRETGVANLTVWAEIERPEHRR